MSQDAPISRADKKAQRDADRHKSGKKRKHSETAKDEPNALPPGLDEEDRQDVATESKKSKKRKHDQTESGDSEAVPFRAEGEEAQSGADTSKAAETKGAVSSSTAKNKKRRREKYAEKLKAAGEVVDVAAPTVKKSKKNVEGDTPTSPDKAESAIAKHAAPKPSERFIVFVGNLPFNTTDFALKAHFKKLEPYTLRHRTDPQTKKSKGFAFLEFENYDRMKTCLQMYHHSMFDPEDKELGGKGKGTGRGGRQINVELTAGGGGKTKDRKDKIRVKNVRLEEQRQRKAETERKEEGKKKGKNDAGKKRDERRPRADAKVELGGDPGGMHPSRMAMMGV